MTINRVTLATVFLLCAPLSILAQPTPPPCPTASVAYLHVTDWTAIEPIHSVGLKTTNVAGAAFSFSYGAAKVPTKAHFRNSKPPYQLTTNILTVCLVAITDSGRDITVAKFQEEKDRR
jgi:hypothetical protein